MTIQPLADFRHQWSVFWATSYTVDLRAFEELWLPRLGDPPLNATLLIDHEWLGDLWDRASAAPESLPRRANRHYLLRGVQVTSGTFHPKTYLFANAKDGVLLVGSGNLTLSGLEDGDEVFCRFDSRNAKDRPVFLDWRRWMQRLVERTGDGVLSARWADALSRVPWMRGEQGASTFLTNWEAPLLDSVVGGLAQPADELHITAPYFDEQCGALASLLRATRPAEVHVYLGKDASVDGKRLATVLAEGGIRSHVWRFHPPRFTHAKLVGIVTGSSGVVLCGSANLSKAALAGSVADGWGNVEAGVLTPAVEPHALRSLFLPEGASLVKLAADELEAYHYLGAPQSADGALPLRLRAAIRRDDGHIEVLFDGPFAEPLALLYAAERFPLDGGVTLTPLPVSDRTELVRLCDLSGDVLSNAVAVDETTELLRALRERSSQAERIAELGETDLATPVGAMLAALNAACQFDIDESHAAKSAHAASEEAEEDPEFWDNFVREQLALDPRTSKYRDFGGTAWEEDDIFLLLQVMLARAPQLGDWRILGGRTVGDEDHGPGEGEKWRPERRLQLRVYHVLDRWCRAVRDPRLRWIDPSAPVRNFLHLLTALVQSAEGAFLPSERIRELTGTLLTSFVAGGASPGFLASLDPEMRHTMSERVDDHARDAATALAYEGLNRDSTWRSRVLEWQAFLVPAIEWGLLRASDGVVGLLPRLGGSTATLTQIDDRLMLAATYIDDAEWCLRAASSLGLGRVTFTQDPAAPFPVTVHVEGVADPLRAASLVALARLALAYKKTDRVVIAVQAGRIAVRLFEHANALLTGQRYRSTDVVSPELLEQLERTGSGWGAMLAISSEKVS